MFCANIGLHTFYVSFRENTQAVIDDEVMVPFFNELYCGGQSVYSEVSRLTVADAMDANLGALVDIPHNNNMVTHLPATPENVALLRTIDGRKTLKQVFAIAASRMGAGGCEQAHERCRPLTETSAAQEVLVGFGLGTVLSYPSTYAQRAQSAFGQRGVS